MLVLCLQPQYMLAVMMVGMGTVAMAVFLFPCYKVPSSTGVMGIP